MRVLLIAPPWLEIYGNFKKAAKIGCVSPPLGLTYLGGSVLNSGYDCRILDMETQCLNEKDVIDNIKEYSPSLIGITATSPVYANAKYLGNIIKRSFPDTPLCIGGVHSTVAGKKVLEECPFFDFQVVGEGENTIVEILKALESRKFLNEIKGLVFRKDGAIVENERRSFVENLDDLPKPARHLLDQKHYKHYLPHKGLVMYANVFTSRGCPFQCIFCSQHTMYGRRVRYHSMKRVISELRDIHNFGIRHVIIMDETMTLNRQRVFEFCNAIKQERFDFTWEGWTHASTVDEDVLRVMKETGLIRLSFGIESGDPEILKIIKKGVTLDQIRRAYKIANNIGIETRGSAIIGFPFETRKSVWRTVKFLRSLKECKQLFLNVACPYPGTELYDCAITRKGGMNLLTDDYSEYKRYGNPVISVNDMSSKDLKRFQLMGLFAFYLTPGRIWYNLIKRTGFRSGLRNAVAFLHGVFMGLISRGRKNKCGYES